MKCERFRADLALLPHVHRLAELPPGGRDHVAKCESCRTLVLQRIGADRLLGSVEEIEPALAFVDRVVAAALDDAEHLTRVSRWSRAKRVMLAAAVVVGAVGVGLWSARATRTEPGETSMATDVPRELLENLDLFLDDWDEVIEHREELDLLAGLEMAETLDLLEENEARR